MNYENLLSYLKILGFLELHCLREGALHNLTNHTKNYTKDFASRYNLKVAANINDVVDPHALQNRDPISAFLF